MIVLIYLILVVLALATIVDGFGEEDDPDDYGRW